MRGHTSGPWRIVGDLVCADTPKGQVELATVYRESEYMARLPHEANARLIAAAPDLLEALKDMTWDADGVVNCAPTQERVMALIAKAEGR